MTFPAADFLHPGQTPQSDPGAIGRAAKACADAGGGTVEVAPGIWSSGAVELGSHVHLHLQTGAVIEFSPDWRRYLTPVFVRWEGVECFSTHPLIYAADAEDVAITGKGILRGNGAAWREFAEKPIHRRRAGILHSLEELPVEKRILDQPDTFLRPSFVHFVRCRDVRWSDFTIEDGPMWTLHPVYCEHLVARDLVIRTSGPNTDGLNPDSCSDVVIENCDFSTGDDAIAIKSGLNSDGWRVGRPCRNIVICRCRMRNGHSGVAFGSELSGGIEKVLIRDCEMDGPGLGIRFKSLPGRGGFVRDVRVENVSMRDIRSAAIHLDMDYAQTTLPTEECRGTSLENISFDRISCRNAAIGVFLKGHPAMPVKALRFDHLEIEAKQRIVREGDAINFSGLEKN